MRHKHTFSVQGLRELKATALDCGASADVLERIDWFLCYAEGNSVSGVCEQFSISRARFYRWAERLNISDYKSLEDHENLLTKEAPQKHVAQDKESFVRTQLPLEWRKWIGISIGLQVLVLLGIALVLGMSMSTENMQASLMEQNTIENHNCKEVEIDSGKTVLVCLPTKL